MENGIWKLDGDFRDRRDFRDGRDAKDGKWKMEDGISRGSRSGNAE
jgi:hypothetical protein